MKKKVKEILIIIFISSILFIIVDFLGSSYLVKSSESIYEKKNMDIMSYQILLKVLNFLGAQFIKSLLINMVLEVRQTLI